MGEQVNLLAVETLLSVPLFLAFASWSHTHTHTLHSNTPGHLHQAKPSPATPAQPPPTRISPRSRQLQYSPSNGHWALTGGILEHQCHLGSRCCFWTRGSGMEGRDKHCVGAPKPHPPLNSTPPLPIVIALSIQRQLHPILFPTFWGHTHHTNKYCGAPSTISSVQVSCSVVSDSLQSHGLQHARLPCPSPTPEAAQTHVH